MSQKIYEIINDKMIKLLEENIIPWRKPWGTTGNGGFPVNGVSGKPYHGINLLMLEWGESYYSFKQIQEKKWHLKKGSKASMVVFFTLIDKKSSKQADNNDKGEKIPIMKYYNVFKSSDIEGCPQPEKFEHNTIAEAEAIVNSYTEVKIEHINNNKAYYSITEDFINTPSISSFPILEEYYSTLFHEMTHSTGHKSRLNRFTGDAETASFGSKLYSQEELVAELGAAFLCGICGIEQMTLENSAAYIQNWLKVLKNDKTMIAKSAAKAQKATDYILGLSS
jgi:antirestriction protein ArdC